MIGPFRPYIISGKPQNDYLYKAALSRRRLLCSHQPGDVVYTQTLESFLIKVFKSPRSYDFLRQTELDAKVTVDNMKKFQELPQQSTINEIANCPDLQTSAGKSCNYRTRKGSFSAARRLKTWLRSTLTKERF